MGQIRFGNENREGSVCFQHCPVQHLCVTFLLHYRVTRAAAGVQRQHYMKKSRSKQSTVVLSRSATTVVKNKKKIKLQLTDALVEKKERKTKSKKERKTKQKALYLMLVFSSARQTTFLKTGEEKRD